jgi:hypothetical protein
MQTHLQTTPEIGARKNRKGIARSVFHVVCIMSLGRRRVAEHTPVEANARNNRTSIARQRPQYAGSIRLTSVAMQGAVNIIEEEVFSMWFAYINCWATDVFLWIRLETTYVVQS